jgi:signal peptidase II
VSSTSAEVLAAQRPRPALAGAIAIVVVLVDQLTKEWALRSLGDGSTVDVIWTLRFRLTFNTGMAFSQGTGLGPIIGVVVIGVVALLVRFLRGNGGTAVVVGGGLVLGGAVGNLIDRIFRGDRWMRGAVVDFIDLQWFPVFNIADSCVVIGGAVLVIGLTRAGRPDVSGSGGAA